MASKKHSGSWFEKQRENKKKENKKLSINMVHWLSQNPTCSKTSTSTTSITSQSISDQTIMNDKDDNKNLAKKDRIEPEPTEQKQYCNEAELIKDTVLTSTSENLPNLEDKTKQLIIQTNKYLNININLSDPGSWPQMNDNIRSYIVERKPYHLNVNHYFPINEDGRHFESKWFFKSLPNGEKVRRQWLLYSISKNALFCFPCLLFKKQNYHRKSSFCDTGFYDWQHLNPRIFEHESSDLHRKCYIDWKEFERRLHDGKTIDDEFQKNLQNEKKNGTVLLK